MMEHNLIHILKNTIEIFPLAEIFRNFIAGKQNLQLGNCGIVEKNVARITQLMAVPLIQGTLRVSTQEESVP